MAPREDASLTGVAATDLVPVADRLRSLGWLRAIIAAAVVVAAVAGATPAALPIETLLATSLVYAVGVNAVGGLWRHLPGRGIALASALLLVDGIYLAWAASVTGGAAGIAPFLVLLHTAAVTLVVSHRTGVKVALWHSLLVYAAYEATRVGVVADGLGGEPVPWLFGYVGVLWLAALGTASFSAINERELRRRRVDLEALAELAAELEPAQTAQQVARTLAERVAENFGFDRVAVVGGRGGSAVLGAAGLTDAPAQTPAPGQGSVLRRAHDERRTQLVSELDAAADAGLTMLLPNARNLLVVPMASDVGVEALVAEHGLKRGSRIERRVVGAVERFVDHGALALRATRLLEEVHKLATIDSLTATATRRVFEEMLRAELSRAIRTDDMFALLMIDIDHFKRVNDVLGHQTGDEVLRGVAETLMASSRDFDLVARYGGEEFAVIAPGCDEPAALAVAERLRTQVEQTHLPVPVTVSIGVALAPEHAEEGEVLIKAADQALYSAKRAGRNRVTIAGGRPG